MRYGSYRQRRQVDERLRPTSSALPVLRVDRQPPPPTPLVGRDDRPERSSQSPVRSQRLLGRGRVGEYARGELPQGPSLSRRTCRLLGPARRADLSRADPNPPPTLSERE